VHNCIFCSKIVCLDCGKYFSIQYFVSVVKIFNRIILVMYIDGFRCCVLITELLTVLHAQYNCQQC